MPAGHTGQSQGLPYKNRSSSPNHTAPGGNDNPDPGPAVPGSCHQPRHLQNGRNASVVFRRGGAPCLFLEGRPHPPLLQLRLGHPGLPGRRAGQSGDPGGRRRRGTQLRSGPALRGTTRLHPAASRTPSWRTWSRPPGGRRCRGPRRAGTTGGPGSRRPGRPARARPQGEGTARSAAPRVAPAGRAGAPGSLPTTTATPRRWRPGPTAAPTHTHAAGDPKHGHQNRPRTTCDLRAPMRLETPNTATRTGRAPPVTNARPRGWRRQTRPPEPAVPSVTTAF
uniref:Synaptopodin 2 n=1 Tax=Rousettus aegyptiacus TaxID=9407 RepID=A0A7J8BUW2_ROUAE|nr:synaptopodin 2 [Rousettus aegyptiacus]